MDGGGYKAADYYFLHNCSTVCLLLFQLEWVLPGSGAGVGQEHCEPDEASRDHIGTIQEASHRFMCHEKEAAINFFFFVPWL